MENVMDDWFTSSNLSRAQRDGSNIKKGHNESPESFEENRQKEIDKWRARRALDSVNNYNTAGMWQYNNDKNERRWVIRSIDHPAFNLVQQTDHLTLDEPVGGTFPTHEGDSEFSCIYRELWFGSDKKAFLDKIYKYACKPYVSGGKDANSVARTYATKGSLIPEKTLWKIFRCLISELVPQDQKWDDIPEYIVDEPNTRWEAGKCMFNILTRGRFWDEESNTLNPVDNGMKFGQHKKNVLQKKYSRSLMKHILGCLAVSEEQRFARKTLLDHFERALSVYDGTYIPEPVDEKRDLPYEPVNKDPLIPEGLTNAEGKVYERLIKIVKKRQQEASEAQLTPHIVTITDLAKDYDDLTAMLCLKELNRLGVVTLEGFVANLMPEDQRALFGRGALDSLGLKEVPMAIGTKGSEKQHLVLDYEFDSVDAFMAPPEKLPELPSGEDLLESLFEKAIKNHRKLTFLGISSLMDVAKFLDTKPDLLKGGISNVVLQGGYRMLNGVLIADPAAQNNNFDLESAQRFHKFMQDNKVPSAVWTKVATFVTAIPTSVFETMANTGHPLGPYLRRVQIAQDKNFYLKACSDTPFQPHMTQPWYLKNKTAWFSSGAEPDEPYPKFEDMVPYFMNVIAYDALAAVGAAGEDVVKEFGFVKPITVRFDAEDDLHKVIGIAPVKANVPPGQVPLPEECNFNPDPMNLVITALLKGSLLSCVQGLPSEP